jgi:hypothetical protein
MLSTKTDAFEAIIPIDILAINEKNGDDHRRFAVSSPLQHADVHSGGALPESAKPIKPYK